MTLPPETPPSDETPPDETPPDETPPDETPPEETPPEEMQQAEEGVRPSEVPTTPPVPPRPSDAPTTPPVRPTRRAEGSLGVAALLTAVLLGSAGLMGILVGAMAYAYQGVTEPPSAGLLSVLNDDLLGITGRCSGGDGDEVSLLVPAGMTAQLSVPARPVACRFIDDQGVERARWAAPDPASAAETWAVRFVATPGPPAEPPVAAAEESPPGVESSPEPPGAAASAAPVISPPPRSAVRRKPAEPAPVVEDPAWTDAAPSTADLLTMVHIEVRRAGKLKGATATMDGSTVNLPGQTGVTTGIHKLRVHKPDVIDLECTIAASGTTIVVVVDPEKPVCP